MAENLTVARPYAKAAFDFAVEQNNLDKWQNFLEAMSIACSDRYYLDHLKLESNSKLAANSLISLLKDLVDENQINFINLIGENSRFDVVPQIYEEFVELRQQHDKVLSCQLICARPFSKTEIDSFKDKLSIKHNCKINLEVKIDPTIVGGAILKIGDSVIDASVKTSLENLSTALR